MGSRGAGRRAGQRCARPARSYLVRVRARVRVRVRVRARVRVRVRVRVLPPLAAFTKRKGSRRTSHCATLTVSCWPHASLKGT